MIITIKTTIRPKETYLVLTEVGTTIWTIKNGKGTGYRYELFNAENETYSGFKEDKPYSILTDEQSKELNELLKAKDEQGIDDKIQEIALLHMETPEPLDNSAF